MATSDIQTVLLTIALNQEKLLKAQEKLQKTVNKLAKKIGGDAKGSAEGGADTVAKKEPSGFAKPCLLSSVLYEFLEIPEGTKVARTEVTKRLTKYIKDHNLQDAANKRVILLDDRMKRLLNPPTDTVVNFFSLQKLMKPHYIAEPKVTGLATEPAAAEVVAPIAVPKKRSATKA